MNDITNEQQKKFGFLNSLLDWKLKGSALNEQIINYHALQPWKSYRKLSTILYIGSSLITFLLAEFIGLSRIEVIIIVALSLFLGVFAYFGNRWALILMIIFWTLDKGITIAQGFIGPGSWIGVFFIWAIFVSIFLKALQIENVRRKESAGIKEPTTKNKTKITMIIFAASALLFGSSFFYYFAARPILADIKLSRCLHEVEREAVEIAVKEKQMITQYGSVYDRFIAEKEGELKFPSFNNAKAENECYKRYSCNIRFPKICHAFSLGLSDDEVKKCNDAILI